MASVLILILLAAQLVVPQNSNPDYVEGYKKQQAGDLSGAAEKYQQVIDADPRHVGARSNLGAVLAAMGRYDDAIEEYRQALEILDHPGIHRNLALAYYKSGRLKEAIGELERMGAGDSANLDLAVVLADCHFRLDDLPEVIEILEPLSTVNPDNLTIAYLLGTAYIREGRVAEGQQLIEKILGKGESAEAHLLLGMAHDRGADLAEAAAEFEKAVALNPKLPTAWSQLGNIRMKLNDRAAAATAYERELENNPNEFDANFYLGVILRESGDPEKALPLIARALRLRPDSYTAQYQLGSVYVQLKRFDEAVPVLERLLTAAPNFPEAHVSLATAYLRLDNKEKAAEHRKMAQEQMTRKRKTGNTDP